MVQLAALSAGSQAPRGRFNGTVHSVFRQACNIQLDDGRLLALLAPEVGNAPHGVRVDVPTGFDFADHVTAGRSVGCRADVLRVAGGELSIDLAPAQPWRGELPGAGVGLANGKVIRAWRAAWHALQRDRRRLDGGGLHSLGRAVDRQGACLARAARDLHADDATDALDRLIGCGPGLTPSGDDLVVGLLAGLWSTTGRRPARRAFLDALCSWVAAAAAATAEALLTLACRITEGADRGAIEAATAAALRVGYTSGGDGTFGLLLGLDAWAPRSVLPLARTRNARDGASPLEPGSRPRLAARSRPRRGTCGLGPARHGILASAVEASGRC
jgi:hypothetical protein